MPCSGGCCCCLGWMGTWIWWPHWWDLQNHQLESKPITDAGLHWEVCWLCKRLEEWLLSGWPVTPFLAAAGVGYLGCGEVPVLLLSILTSSTCTKVPAPHPSCSFSAC